MAKRKMSENSLKNLEKRTTFKQDKDLARRAQLASAKNRSNRIREQKIQDQIVHTRMTMCDEIYRIIQENGGLEQVTLSAIHNCIEKGQNKDLLKLLDLIRPSERQDIKLTGNIEASNTIVNIIPIKGNNNGD